MSVGITDAWKALNGKITVPSELRTAEWARLPQWIRERSFWMAGVTRAEVLEEFRSEAAAIVAGTTSEEQSLKKLQQYLAGTGYKPAPGQEGTIKDLRTSRRILTTLRTNRELLQGWGQKERGMRPGAMRAFPGWELVRVSARRVPRDWAARFERVGGRIVDGRLVALKTWPGWKLLGTVFLDSIGVDHAPFWWGSGGGLRGVSRAEMKTLGLLGDWTPPPATPVSSPNETLEMKPKITALQVRAAVSKHLEGLAEWNGDTLVFTDPNGTRPYTAEQLAVVWQKPMPQAFQDLPGGGHLQRETLIDWAADSSQFWNDPQQGEKRLGRTDRWDDLQRVLARLQPSGTEKQPLYRALTWNTNEGFSEFLEGVRREGYAAREATPAESWTTSAGSARKYLGEERYQVVLKLPAGHSMGRDISALVRAFSAEIQRRESPQGKLAITDGEVILPSWAGLKVKRIGKLQESENGKFVEIELEEGP